MKNQLKVEYIVGGYFSRRKIQVIGFVSNYEFESWNFFFFQKVTFGISESRNFGNYSCMENSVWAISNDEQQYKDCFYLDLSELAHFRTATKIDMKLDFDENELSFFNLESGKEHIMKNIEENKNGYVPHFNLYYKDTTVSFKKIPLSHYSIN